MSTNPIPTPANEIGDTSLYSTQEAASSSRMEQEDQQATGSLSAFPSVGHVFASTNQLLPVTDVTRRERIQDDVQDASVQLADAGQSVTHMGSHSEKNEANRESLAAEGLKAELDSLRSSGPDSALNMLASRFAKQLQQHPVLLMLLQARGFDFGVPTLDELNAVLEAHTKLTAELATCEKSLAQSEREKEELVNQIGVASDWHLRQSRDEMEELLVSLVGVDSGDFSTWPVEELKEAMVMAGELDAQTITQAAARWIQELRMTTPTATGRSGTEQALWLFAKVHKREMDFSLADIHAVAVAIQSAPRGATTNALAILHQFTKELVKVIKSRGEQCNINCSLILLRSIELLLLHLSSAATGYRLRVLPMLSEAAPFLVQATEGSRLVQGLQAYTVTLATGLRSSTLASFIRVAAAPLAIGEVELVSTGQDLLWIEGNQITFVHGHKFKLELNPISGLQLVVTDMPSPGEVWRSPFWEFSHQNVTRIKTNFGAAYNRLTNMYELWSLDARLEAFHIGCAD